MAQATMDAAKELAGKDNAMKAKKVITLATVPLKGVEEKALKHVASEEEIILPKNSVCRKKTRGGSTQNNERLLAFGLFASPPRANWKGEHRLASDGRRHWFDVETSRRRCKSRHEVPQPM